MVDTGSSIDWIRNHITEIRKALIRDARWMALATLLFAVLGAMIGKMNTAAVSTAQLVVAPMPFRVDPTPDDAIARMLASPMDVKTVVILCTSDETFQKTLAVLQAPPLADQLIAPPEELSQLRSMLSYEITVEKETPYDLEYSPVVKLNAKASKSNDARLIVNAWAKVCEEAAMEYQAALHQPATKVFTKETALLFEDYQAAQEELATFQYENIIPLYQARIASMVQNIANLDTSRAEILEAINRAEAELLCNREVLSKSNSIDLYEKRIKVIEEAIGKLLEERPGIDQEIDEAKKQLEWHEKMLTRESKLSLLQVRIAGIEESVEDLEQQRPELLQNIRTGKASVQRLEEELRQEDQKLALDWKASPEAAALVARTLGGKSRPEEGLAPLLEMEKLNENYVEIRGDLAEARVELAADEAALENLDQLIADLKRQREDIQLMLAETDLSQERIQPVETIGTALAESRLTFYEKEAALQRTDEIIDALTEERERINTAIAQIDVDTQRMEPLSMIGQKLSDARLELATQQSALKNTEVLRAQYTSELDELQKTLVAAQIKEENLKTNVATLGGAYANMLGKDKFARIANQLAASPQVQILFEGAEWRTPRFRYAIIGAFFAALWGLLIAGSLSLTYRMVFVPLFRPRIDRNVDAS